VLRLRCTVMLLLWFAASLSAFAQTEKETSLQRAHTASQALLSLYDRQNGLFRTMGWWNSANAITALADEAKLDRASNFDTVFANTFRQAQHHSPGFINRFYDDEGWWALAWIDVYELAGNEAYLHMAESIFDDMATGWDDTCGGGVWWNKDRRYKNAIPNELFLTVAAKLASKTTGAQRRKYLQWADLEWRWFAVSGLINDRGLINDGLDANCKNNHALEFTYNQGVILAGLTDLSSAEHDPQLIDRANHIASAALSYQTNRDGVLQDPCEPRCRTSGDAKQFKGIFVRGLADLQQASPNERYAKFLRANAGSVWNHARTPENNFSMIWAGPPENDGGSALGSALDLLVAQAQSK
jgi:predicted alpha-1,6-mannanase (GH76 family)